MSDEDKKDKDVETAIKLASDRAHEYQVEGYGRQDDGYGGPYHPEAFKDPQVQFALAGAPEAQVQYTEELRKVAEEKAAEGAVDKVDILAGSAVSTVLQDQAYRAPDNAPDRVKDATPENLEKAEERKTPEAPVESEDEDKSDKPEFKFD
jgi:hypothetical protein